MNKFGVSSRAKPLRTGSWLRVTKKEMAGLAMKITASELKGNKTVARSVKTDLEKSISELKTIVGNLEDKSCVALDDICST